MGNMTVEEIYRDRKTFSSKVFEVATTDLVNMGMQVSSITQFQSVDFLQSRFTSAVFDSRQSTAHLTGPFFVVLEATHEASREPLKDAMSAQKAPKGPRRI